MRTAVAALTASLLCLAPLASGWSPRAGDTRWAQRAFDHRCADVDLASDQYRVHCAADGRTAALQGPVDAHLADRLGATLAWRTTQGNTSIPRGSVSVSVQGPLVIVEQVTCAACRRVLGHTWVLRPERAPDALLRTVQRAAGLGTTTLRRSVAAWRAARP